jgi:hypothetical protein
MHHYRISWLTDRQMQAQRCGQVRAAMLGYADKRNSALSHERLVFRMKILNPVEHRFVSETRISVAGHEFKKVGAEPSLSTVQDMEQS